MWIYFSVVNVTPHFPIIFPLLSLHKRASSHHDWLGGKRPKLPPLPNQESVSPPCTGDLNPLQSVQRDFKESAQNKDRWQVLNNGTATELHLACNISHRAY